MKDEEEEGSDTVENDGGEGAPGDDGNDGDGGVHTGVHTVHRFDPSNCVMNTSYVSVCGFKPRAPS